MTDRRREPGYSIMVDSHDRAREPAYVDHYGDQTSDGSVNADT